MSQEAAAESWTVTRQYYPGGSTSVYRSFDGNGDGSVTRLGNPAPGNNCPVPAFEIMNPGRGEARCVGYVVPSWLTR